MSEKNKEYKKLKSATQTPKNFRAAVQQYSIESTPKLSYAKAQCRIVFIVVTRGILDGTCR